MRPVTQALDLLVERDRAIIVGGDALQHLDTVLERADFGLQRLGLSLVRGRVRDEDFIAVTIAAHACRLLLHRTTNYYPQLTTVLVYPHSFIVERVSAGPAGQVLESEQVLAGESWRHGPRFWMA